jgi:tRNA A-37 threonylcarbamoyl transferase component Bud32
LGRGGMAEIYKAYQPGVERHVAIKVLHGHLRDNADSIQRFQREARSIGQLQHPHIVRVLDFDAEADVYYMVMDYMQGGALDSVLAQKRMLPVDQAVRITLQLADALAYAHEQGMIHRDIKPSNILFSDESHRHALLTDFGLARLLDEQHRITMTGALVGTPNYMSPEAARGERCDARSDLYSLAVVLYELVTGRTPYAATTPYSFLMKQDKESLPPPRTLNPKLPAALETILLKALAKAPSARYQSAAEFATALRRMQTTASATTTGDLLMMQPKQMRPPLMLAGMGVLAIAIVTAFALLRLDTGAQANAPAAVATVTPASVALVALPTVTPTPIQPVTPVQAANAITAAGRVTRLLTDTTPALTGTTPLTEAVAISAVVSTPALTTTVAPAMETAITLNRAPMATATPTQSVDAEGGRRRHRQSDRGRRDD